MKTTYDPEADAAYIRVSQSPIASTEELSDTCVLDRDASGHIVGIELLSVFGFAGASLALLVDRGLLSRGDSQKILADLRGEVVAAA
jgi:uncharacterized protein YuzE